MTKRHPSESRGQLEFKAKDFHHHPKNQFWYIGMGLLLIALLILALRFGEYLLAGVVVAAAVAIFRLGNLQPSKRAVNLTEKGVYWGDKFYGYHQLRAFWLADQDDRATLYLERLNFAPQISFVIPASSADQAISFLGRHLPYHDHRGEPLTDRFSRLLRL